MSQHHAAIQWQRTPYPLDGRTYPHNHVAILNDQQSVNVSASVEFKGTSSGSIRRWTQHTILETDTEFTLNFSLSLDEWLAKLGFDRVLHVDIQQPVLESRNRWEAELVGRDKKIIAKACDQR